MEFSFQLFETLTATYKKGVIEQNVSHHARGETIILGVVCARGPQLEKPESHAIVAFHVQASLIRWRDIRCETSGVRIGEG
jgi:hypothetical protein